MPNTTTQAGGIEAHHAESYIVLPGRADAGLIVVCDHAGNAFPEGYGTLGLDPGDLNRHIAYDIGAEGVTRRIAAAFGAPAVMTRYSRLLIDPNRGADDPTLIMRLSDGAIVPGNRHVDAAERENRLRRFWKPYHAAIESVIARCKATGRPPAILSIHSFTESWKGVARPWHVGVLWDRDDRMARPLIEGFAADGQLLVGDNQPYRGGLAGDCLDQHAVANGLPSVLIEYRQDLIRDGAGQKAWAERTIAVLHRLLERPDLNVSKAVSPPAAAQAAAPPRRAAHHSKGSPMPVTLDDKTRTELEAAAYRRLVEHLRQRTDVQNIDLMNLAGFCRNCLANWLKDAADAKGQAMSKDDAREIVYGMPYKEWQAKHQTEASAEQKAAYEKSKPQH